MQPAEAKAILTSLLEGRHPVSGECIPSECNVHHTDVLRALPLGVRAIDAVDACARRRATLPENVGHTWSAREEDRLRSEFASHEPLDAIAARHGRTLRAIEARLQHMGLITAEERTTRGGFATTD